MQVSLHVSSLDQHSQACERLARSTVATQELDGEPGTWTSTEDAQLLRHAGNATSLVAYSQSARVPLGTLQPGQYTAIPVAFVDKSATLCIRPCSSAHVAHRWSSLVGEQELLMNPDSLGKLERFLLRCDKARQAEVSSPAERQRCSGPHRYPARRPSDAHLQQISNAACFISGHVSSKQLGSLKSRDWTIVFKPPVAVQNLLPWSLDVRVCHMPQAELSVASEMRTAVYALGAADTLSVRIKADAHKWSNAVQVVAAGPSSGQDIPHATHAQHEKADRIEMQHINHRQDTVVQMELEACHDADDNTRRIVATRPAPDMLHVGYRIIAKVFAPLWVQNLSSVPVKAVICEQQAGSTAAWRSSLGCMAARASGTSSAAPSGSTGNGEGYPEIICSSDSISDQPARAVACSKVLEGEIGVLSCRSLSTLAPKYTSGCLSHASREVPEAMLHLRVSDAPWSPGQLLEPVALQTRLRRSRSKRKGSVGGPLQQCGTGQPVLLRAHAENGLEYILVVTLHALPAPYGQSQLLCLKPRLVVRNHSGQPLRMQQILVHPTDNSSTDGEDLGNFMARQSVQGNRAHSHPHAQNVPADLSGMLCQYALDLWP